MIGIRAGEAARRDPALRQRELEALQVLAAQGRVRPHVSLRLQFAEFAEAIRALDERKAIGRIALEIAAA